MYQKSKHINQDSTRCVLNSKPNTETLEQQKSNSSISWILFSFTSVCLDMIGILLIRHLKHVALHIEHHMSAQWKLRSACASAESDHSLRCPHEEFYVLRYHRAAIEDFWSDFVDAQADLRVRWAHISVCRFCVSFVFNIIIIWATSWQNQQSGCAPGEDSDQPEHPPSLIRVFAAPSMDPSFLHVYSADWLHWADA